MDNTFLSFSFFSFSCFFLFFPFYPFHTAFSGFPCLLSCQHFLPHLGILPQFSKPKPASSKLIAAAITSVAAATIVVSFAVFLHLRRWQQRIESYSNDTKTQRLNSSRSQPPNVHPSSRSIPKLRRPSQTSSEFLYLGTSVNSHGAIDHSSMQQNARASSNADDDDKKIGSPELRPLPPLTGRRQNPNADVGSAVDEEDEEFHSPRGSLMGRESSIGTGSASRREFAAVGVENLGHRSSSASYSSSSSGSDSPVRSVSPSISPPVSSSPKISRPKSPELVALQSAPPPRPPPLPAAPPSLSIFNATLVQQNVSPSPSPTLSPSPSPSPPSSSSPERVYGRSRESSPRTSNASDSDHALESPVDIRRPSEQNVAVSIPSPPPAPPPPPAAPPVSIPPPPPLPPRKHWESPETPSPAAMNVVSEPPKLVNPLGPLSLESPTMISPMQLPANLEPFEKNEGNVESSGLSNENEVNPKPKLKPLHWDKVRASSDREMVWDQLKESSFR